MHAHVPPESREIEGVGAIYHEKARPYGSILITKLSADKREARGRARAGVYLFWGSKAVTGR